MCCLNGNIIIIIISIRYVYVCKRGNRNDAGNYKDIVLINTSGKLFTSFTKTTTRTTAATTTTNRRKKLINQLNNRCMNKVYYKVNGSHFLLFIIFLQIFLTILEANYFH